MNKKIYIISILLCFTSIYGCTTSSQDNKISQIEESCKSQFAASDYDPIRGKIELYPTTNGPSDLLDHSRKKITDEEKPAMKQFISLFSKCMSDSAGVIYREYPSLGMRSIKQANLEIDLLKQLYHGDLTWGEFTDKRYDVLNQRASFETQRMERDLHQYQTEQRQQQETRINNFIKQQEQQRLELDRNRPKNISTRCYRVRDGEIQCDSNTW